jgi:hypothetical protein
MDRPKRTKIPKYDVDHFYGEVYDEVSKPEGKIFSITNSLSRLRTHMRSPLSHSTTLLHIKMKKIIFWLRMIAIPVLLLEGKMHLMTKIRMIHPHLLSNHNLIECICKLHLHIQLY